MKYMARFEFYEPNDPPETIIIDERGAEIAQVYDNPICLADEWTDDPEQWRPGEIGAWLLKLMNESTNNLTSCALQLFARKHPAGNNLFDFHSHIVYNV